MKIEEIERELKKRLEYPYSWKMIQKDDLDRKTNFIYQCEKFDELIAEIRKNFQSDSKYDMICNYAMNRWYNFWSARAVEEVFCSLDRVQPSKNSRDRLVDFQIDGVSFDHKTSVFPKGYQRPLDYAKKNPQDLIKWLYENQSKEGRMHLKNRLFVVLYSRNGEHWKLKSEISWLKGIICEYVQSFNFDNLRRFEFEKGIITLSDIIWGIK